MLHNWKGKEQTFIKLLQQRIITVSSSRPTLNGGSSQTMLDNCSPREDYKSFRSVPSLAQFCLRPSLSPSHMAGKEKAPLMISIQRKITAPCVQPAVQLQGLPTAAFPRSYEQKCRESLGGVGESLRVVRVVTINPLLKFNDI